MTGLIEMLILFGALLAFLVWELFSVNRALRRDQERKNHASKTDDSKVAAAPVRVDPDTDLPRD